MTDHQSDLAAIAAAINAEKRDPEIFLAAWRDAIALIGEGYFMLRKPLSECTTKWDMEPKVDALRSRLGVMSSGEAVFVKCVLQFFDDRCMHKQDVPTLVDISNRLDAERLRIVMRLMRHYGGW